MVLGVDGVGEFVGVTLVGVDCTGVGKVTPSETLVGVGDLGLSGIAPSEAGGRQRGVNRI
jgi:hypothetical protein